MKLAEVVKGGIHSDERGTISFVNDFDLKNIRRFYTIEPANINVIRAWQGHQKESKWFYCIAGAFIVKLIKIDNWDKPSLDLEYESFNLTAEKSQVLSIPPGYANGFRALRQNSKLLVFSDLTLQEAKDDNFRFQPNYWFDWNTAITL